MTPLKSPVSRKGTRALGGEFGPDRDKPLVVTITPSAEGDLLTLRPLRTSRGETAMLVDVYRWMIRSRVLRGQLERARVAKARKAERDRLAAERRLTAAARRAARKEAA